MKVLLTGATGLIGTELSALLLQNGISVHYLTTAKKKIKNEPNYVGFYWNPSLGIIDENALMGVDSIIHLAGATISKRWTKSYKQEIIESRLVATNTLFTALKNNPNQVKQLISASGTAIYPNNSSQIFDENTTQMEDSFLGNVVYKWEESVDKFKLLNITVCKLRTGIVFSNKGGALMEMVKPIKLGVGASFGSGKQIQSWIHIDDISALYLHALENCWEGVFNAVSPNPISNNDITKALAFQLKKPLLLPNIPQFVMKFILGEMHVLLFENRTISSKKAEKAGFDYKFPTVTSALENLF